MSCRSSGTVSNVYIDKKAWEPRSRSTSTCCLVDHPFLHFLYSNNVLKEGVFWTFSMRYPSFNVWSKPVIENKLIPKEATIRGVPLGKDPQINEFYSFPRSF